jgi:transposase
VQQARARWFEPFAHLTVDQLIFIDEFGAATNMTRTRARGPRGQRVVCKAPQGHWKILSTIAALSTRGIIACGSFDGATDAETFVAFVREGLVPQLRAGQVVVLDNLSAHRSPQVDALIESCGAKVLRLPPYSPDYNPIEMAISKIKSLLRSMGRRSIDELYQAIGKAAASITCDDALHYIQHCGYAATII